MSELYPNNQTPLEKAYFFSGQADDLKKEIDSLTVKLEKRQALVAWLNKLHEVGNGFLFDGDEGAWYYPNETSNLDNYQINPPKPKEYWINIYPNFQSTHNSRNSALSNCMNDGHTIKVVEVPEEV